ncbi:MAG: CheR family methyltransferase [bacterium]
MTEEKDAITDTALQKIKREIQDRAGMVCEREQYVTRLKREVDRRMNKLGFDSIDSYLNYIDSSQGNDEITSLIDEIVVNETLFYRNSQQMDILEQEIFPRLLDKRSSQESAQIRILSAGCSDGAEPYSLVIACKEVKQQRDDIDNVTCRVTGLDISRSALEKARKGYYSKRSVENAPERVVNKYFEPRNSGYKIKRSIPRNVSFDRKNLLNDSLPKNQDIVLIRNVLIYFEENDRKKILRRLVHSMKPSGYIITGYSEDLAQYSDLVDSSQWGNQIYRPASLVNKGSTQTSSGSKKIRQPDGESTGSSFKLSVQSTADRKIITITRLGDNVSKTVIRGRLRSELTDLRTTLLIDFSDLQSPQQKTVLDIIDAIRDLVDQEAEVHVKTGDSSLRLSISSKRDDVQFTGGQRDNRTNRNYGNINTSSTEDTVSRGEGKIQREDRWEIEVNEAGESMNIRVSGKLDVDVEEAIKRQLKEALEDCIHPEEGTPSKSVVILLDEVTHLDRSVVQLLKRLQRLFSTPDSNIAVKATSQRILTRLERWGCEAELYGTSHESEGVHRE